MFVAEWEYQSLLYQYYQYLKRNNLLNKVRIVSRLIPKYLLNLGIPSNNIDIACNKIFLREEIKESKSQSQLSRAFLIRRRLHLWKQSLVVSQLNPIISLNPYSPNPKLIFQKDRLNKNLKNSILSLEFLSIK